MIWFVICLFALYVALSFPAVWAMGKLDKKLGNEPGERFAGATLWPVFLIIVLIYQLVPMWDSIYLKMFPGEKEK